MKPGRNFNLLNIFLIITMIFSLSGYLLAKAEKTGLNKVIKGKEKISVDVLINDLFTTDKNNSLLKVGNKTTLTIRNKPYAKLIITNVQSNPKFTTIPDGHGSFKTIPDPARENIKDYIVTLSDTALKTDDGYVAHGSKVKIGNQVELEGSNYRLSGKVINVSPI